MYLGKLLETGTELGADREGRIPHYVYALGYVFLMSSFSILSGGERRLKSNLDHKTILTGSDVDVGLVCRSMNKTVLCFSDDKCLHSTSLGVVYIKLIILHEHHLITLEKGESSSSVKVN